jgi:hypothetical protein
VVLPTSLGSSVGFSSTAGDDVEFADVELLGGSWIGALADDDDAPGSTDPST